MDPLKEAFSNVKDDIGLVKKELAFLKKELIETRKSLIGICEVIKKMAEKQEKILPTPQQITPTGRQQITRPPADTSTDNSSFRSLKDQYQGVSIGNQGVPTDKQTNQQTNRHIEKSSYNQKIITKEGPPRDPEQTPKKDSFDSAREILDTLDNMKKEVRLKFKKLTDQEMIVFSTLYQLEQEALGRGEKGSNYREISEKLKLSESSIRDYIGRLVKKGIPVEKTKLNNKSIMLFVSQNLKKIASLDTILELRDL